LQVPQRLGGRFPTPDRSILFAPSETTLSFLILGQRVRVECQDLALRAVLVANFGTMASAYEDSRPDLDYLIQSEAARGFSLTRRGQPAIDAVDQSDFLYLLEKDITIELQKQRPDLFFLHSAALDWHGKAYLLVAESGGGKSTTAWALLHHGFQYLTDELSPVDLHSMRVFPYPHALCLKRLPPQLYPLPGDVVHLGRTMHVPARSFPSAAIFTPRPLGAVFLLKYCPNLDAPNLRAIGPAEAGAHLYVSALNALAHPNHGLDAVARIAEQVPCFAVSSAELHATCGLIRSAVGQGSSAASSGTESDN
jgi:hypothetical protein